MKSNLGAKIRKCRELRNFSQSTIARQLGLSQKAFSNIENNITPVTVDRLENIAQILNMSPIQLMTFDENEFLGNPSLSAKDYKEPLYEQLEQERLLYKELLKTKDELLKVKDQIIHSLAGK